MSYNIDSVEVVSGQLSISLKDVFAIKKACAEDLPETNFIDEILENTTLVSTVGMSDIINLDDGVNWCHGGSGYRFDKFKEILGMTTGKIDLVLIWEGGDSVTGLRVENGVVTEKKVKYVLE